MEQGMVHYCIIRGRGLIVAATVLSQYAWARLHRQYASVLVSVSKSTTSPINDGPLQVDQRAVVPR
jgi:hypothetical protein